jgi:ribulose 1,5-bisphosphate synthetase/thiazole synthase
MGAVLACQEIFCNILRRKLVAGDAIGGGWWLGGRSFEKSSHLLVKSPAKRAQSRQTSTARLF